MATSIQDHPNYGLDVHTVQREMSIPLRTRIRLLKATVQTLNNMRKEIGLRRLLAMLRNVKRRVDDALVEYDFSRVRARGLSDTDLRVILDRMLTGQEMAKEMGLEKAKELRMAGSKAIANDYFGSVFPTQDYLEQCPGAFCQTLRPSLQRSSPQVERRAFRGAVSSNPLPICSSSAWNSALWPRWPRSWVIVTSAGGMGALPMTTFSQDTWQKPEGDIGGTARLPPAHRRATFAMNART